MTGPEGAKLGRVITFYSYKGGTGRTMALANIAWILASNGYRVLTIDWDLESPGLHRYFHPFLKDKELRTTDGVINMIRHFAERVTNEGPQPDWQSLTDLQNYAVSLDWDFGDRGALDFVGAGMQDQHYSASVSTFDWADFWDRLNGGYFVAGLRENMRRSYDFVLIDSRTGLSDSAGICTVELPDAVVNCFTLNTQSVSGAVAVAKSIVDLRANRKMTIYPVPSRVENGEQRKLQRGRSYARRSFDSFLDFLKDDETPEDYWGKVELPYRVSYAYEEVLATFGDPPRQENSLLSPYVRLASRLAGREVKSPELPDHVRQRTLLRFERPDTVDPATVLLNYAPLDRIYAEWLREQLYRVGHRGVLHPVEAQLPDLTKVDKVVALVSRDYIKFPQAGELWRQCDQFQGSSATDLLVPVRIDDTALPATLDRASLVDFTAVRGERALETLFRALRIQSDQPLGSGNDDEITVRHPTTLAPHWNVQLVRNTRFAGRHSVLEELRDTLLANPSGSRIALVGINGVGKTQIALEYLYRFAAAYDIVWWISAGHPDQLRTALADMATELNVGTGGSIDGQVSAAREALRTGVPSRRWLIVVDNADDPDLIRELLPNGPGHVIITSRNPAWNREMDTLDIDVFKRAESVALFGLRAPGVSANDARQLAEKLGDLPLAIEQASAWLAVTGMPAPDYVQELENVPAELLAQGAPADRTMTATVQVSLSRLREQNPAAARLLELFAFLAPEAIPSRIVFNQRMAELLAQENIAMRDRLLHATLISDIGRYALARIDAGSGGVVVHRLTQEIIRAGLPEAERAQRRSEIQTVLAAVDRRDPDDRDNWPVYEELRKHLEHTGALESELAEVRELVTDMVRYLRRRSDSRASQELAEKTLFLWKRLFPDPDDRHTLMLRFQLANALRAQGMIDQSYEIDADVHERMVATLAEDHPYTLMASGGLAADLRERGEYGSARRFDERGVAGLKRQLGDSHPRTIMAINNLAVSLRLNGDYAAATQLDRENHRAARRHWGADHPSSLLAVSNYGRDLREIGDLRGSRTTLEEVVERYLEALGDDHADCWRAAKNYAVTLRRLGEIEKSHSVTLGALHHLARLLGNDAAATMACRLEFAAVLWALGEPDAARQRTQEMHDFHRKRHPHHPSALIVANNLSIYRRATGDLAGSLQLAEETAAALQAALGPRHPNSLLGQMNLANALYATQSFALARERDEEVHARLVEVLKDPHPAVLAAAINLAISRAAVSSGGEQRSRSDAATLRARQQLGDNHPYTLAGEQGQRIDIDIEQQPV